MVDLSLVLDDEELRRRFGAVTLARAEEYLASGHVVAAHDEVDEDGDLDIRGTVAGTRHEPYQCFVAVGLGARGVWLHSRCTCPVLDMCKHAATLLLHVRARQEAAGGGRRWERQLGFVLDELDEDNAGAVARRKPLGLLFELAKQPPSRYRAWAHAPTPGRGSLRIRPVQHGARDNWVRSGISWHDVPYAEARGHHADHVAVLGELLASYRAAQRQLYGSEGHLPVSGFGPSLWPLLARARDAGLALVPGSGIARVILHAPVSLELDVNAADGGDSHLRLGVRTDDEWYDVDSLDLLGANGHGVALWSPSSTGTGQVLTLAPLTRPPGPQLRRLTAPGTDLVVPASDRDALVGEYLPRLQRHVPVSSSDGSVDVPEPAEPGLAVTLTWVSVDEAHVSWTWRYETATGTREYALGETRGLRGLRRPDLETQLLDALELDDDAAYRLTGRRSGGRDLVPEQTFAGYAAVAFAEETLPALEKAAADGRLELVEVGGRPDYREAHEAPVVHFAARDDGGETEPERTDWLDLEVLISVEGDTLTLPDLLAALTRGEDRVVLRSGVHVAVDRPEFAQLAELVTAAGELVEQPRDGVRVGHHDLGLWDELAEIGLVDAQAAQWVEAAQALRGLSTLPDPAPEQLEAELRPYQRDGFRWLAFLWQSRLGGILADDMGLGKTLQTLALVAHARARGSAPFLVVAPTSVVSTWAHEAAQFTPGLAVRTVTESQARRGTSLRELAQDADLVITSYTLYRLEADDYVHLGPSAWGGLVLDEAQTVKNHQGKTYQAVRRLDVPFRLALTGTPLENRLMELWSLLSIVAPGLYPWPQRFAELVANPVERLGDADVLERFRRRIRPFLLRRTKELVAADLPPKQEQVLDVRLTAQHRRIYDTHLQRERQTVLGLVDDFEKHRIAIFRSLTRLRQLSLDPALVDPEHERVGSAKTDVLVDHLVELAAEGHRALVFSQFTSFLRRVRDRLERERIGTTYLDGSTTHRGEVVEEFRSGEAPVFLISLKAGGVGLTLTEADYVFVLDPWWNPAVEAQAVDRAHRIGQDKPVMVYRMVSEGTIEEKVMELKARKAALFAKVMDGDGAALGMSEAIDADDVRALLD